MRALHLALAITSATVLVCAPYNFGPAFRLLAREVQGSATQAERLATRQPPSLVLSHWECLREADEIALVGEVRNDGTYPLTSVIAVGVFQARSGELVKADRALLASSTLLAGQTSRFEVRTSDDPAIASCAIDFGHLMGGSLSFVEERDRPDPTRLDAAQIRALQRHLIDLGYDVGRPDGVLGPQTRNAILDYQRDEGLTPTGLITPEVIARLR